MQVIGIFAVVLSLIFVGLQMRQEHDIAIVDTYGSVAEAHMNLSVLIGENMSIWKKGLEGDELTEDERGMFAGLVAAVSSHYQRNFIRWAKLGPGNPDNFASEFAYALYVFPGMRKVLEANWLFDNSRNAARGFGSELIPWRSRILHYLAKFDEKKAPVPDTKAFIFWAY
jgi:hypothetical protein